MKNYFDNLLSRTQIVLKKILGIDVAKMDEERVEGYFEIAMKPKYLIQNKMNEVISMEKSFEATCAVLEDNGISNPKRLTIFEFFSKVEFLETKFKTKNNG